MRQHGHTLIGLLMALAIAAILMTMAYPSFSSVMERAHLQTCVDRLYDALWFTRSSAVSHQQSVVMTTVTSDWEDGWQIFIDENADGVQQSSEMTLRAVNAIADDIRIRSNQGIGPAVYYHADGQSRKPGGALQMGRLTLCADDQAQAIIINAVGRPRIEPQVSADC